MKKLSMLLMLGALVSCSVVYASDYVWKEKSYDPEYGVVCYKAYGGALSCVKVGT